MSHPGYFIDRDDLTTLYEARYAADDDPERFRSGKVEISRSLLVRLEAEIDTLWAEVAMYRAAIDGSLSQLRERLAEFREGKMTLAAELSMDWDERRQAVESYKRRLADIDTRDAALRDAYARKRSGGDAGDGAGAETKHA